MLSKTQSVVTYLNDKKKSPRRPGRKGSGGRSTSPALNKNFIAQHRNNKDGKEAVERFAGAEWDEQNGDLMRQAEMDCADIDKRINNSEKDRETTDRKYKETTRRIKRVGNSGAALSGETMFAGTPFGEWQKVDQTVTCISAGVVFVLMLMSVVNATSLMWNSGAAVFLDHPWIGFVMAFLLPATSLAIKFIHDVFETDYGRKLYAVGIYGLAFILLVWWIILFAGTYGGLTGDIDWQTLGEPGSGGTKGSLLTGVQLFAEVVAGAALFLVITTIANKYSADAWYANPEWEDARKAKEEAEAAHAKLIDEQKKAHGFRDQLHASRFVFVERCVADWHSLQDASH